MPPKMFYLIFVLLSSDHSWCLNSFRLVTDTQRLSVSGLVPKFTPVLLNANSAGMRTTWDDDKYPQLDSRPLNLSQFVLWLLHFMFSSRNTFNNETFRTVQPRRSQVCFWCLTKLITRPIDLDSFKRTQSVHRSATCFPQPHCKWNISSSVLVLAERPVSTLLQKWGFVAFYFCWWKVVVDKYSMWVCIRRKNGKT